MPDFTPDPTPNLAAPVGAAAAAPGAFLEDLRTVLTFLRWLVRLDDPLDDRGVADRTTVTLNQIIDKARHVEPLVAALAASTPEPNSWRVEVTVPVDLPLAARDQLFDAIDTAVHRWQPADRVGWDPFLVAHAIYDDLAESAARDPGRPTTEDELLLAGAEARTRNDDGTRHSLADVAAEFGVELDESAPASPSGAETPNTTQAGGASS